MLPASFVVAQVVTAKTKFATLHKGGSTLEVSKAAGLSSILSIAFAACYSAASGTAAKVNKVYVT